MTAKIFEGFDCRKIGDDSTIMSMDYEIDCDSDAYTATFIVCLVLTLLWPIGVPSYLLYSMRRNLT